MANIHILANPSSDTGTLSGGAWLASLPLANLRTQQPKQVARSSGLTAAATRFTIDQGRTLPVSMFALIATNLSNGAVVRYRVSEAADGSSPVLDVSMPAFAPNVAWGAQVWGVFPWEGFQADDQPGGPIVFYKAPVAAYGRFLLVDIADPANPAGYVEIGRFMAGEAFVPAINIRPGARFRFLDESGSSRTVGGQDWFDLKPKRRRADVEFASLSEGEAKGAIYDMQRRLGITGNLLLVRDPGAAPSIVLRETLYGRMPELSDIVTALPGDAYPYSCNFSVEELL